MIYKNLWKIILSLLIGGIMLKVCAANRAESTQKPETAPIIQDVLKLSELDMETESKIVPPKKDIETPVSDFEQLKKYYIVDSKTGLTSDYFDYGKFMSADLKIKRTPDKPSILVFHTHSQEMFKDSNKDDLSEGITGAGERLCSKLEKDYGLKCIHVTESFDMVDGKNHILGAYERMEPVIRDIINKNPSIDMVIDMHRDGVPESTHLVENINGEQTAQVMFFNGICRINKDGRLSETQGLVNPYIPTNLALSFRMKQNCDAMYPRLARKIYINAYRYSLHMMPKSTLIEVGAQTNTKQEIYNAIDCLAEVIAKTVS